jgi:Na+-transporting NADH:ubiquinone oxidoreductase subunit C
LVKTDFEVDAIAGSTITGDGLAAMLKKDLKMYLPYLKTIKQ